MMAASLTGASSDASVAATISASGGVSHQLSLAVAEFAAAIRSGERAEPDFDSAVERHRLLDRIQQASDTGERQVV